MTACCGCTSPNATRQHIRPKQVRGRNRYFGQGELSRLCREAFRDAPGPLSVADLVAAVIAAKGFDAGDRMLRDRIDDLVKAALGPMRRVGSVEKIGEGRGVRWKLAEREPGLPLSRAPAREGTKLEPCAGIWQRLPSGQQQ